MSFNRGDLITATELNNTNGEEWSYQSGHLNSDGRKPFNFFFYLMRPSGDEFGTGECQSGWFANANIQLFRKENGSWVEKDSSYNNGGFYNANVKLTFKSFGEGEYKVYMSSSNYAHHRNITGFVNSKIDNIRGNLLHSFGPMSVDVIEGDNVTSSTTYSNHQGEVLTTEMLNNREVYTD